MTVCDFRHAKLLQDLIASGATVEDLARSLASIEGNSDEFDEGKDVSIAVDKTGHYLGYLCDMEYIIERATKYARERG